MRSPRPPRPGSDRDREAGRGARRRRALTTAAAATGAVLAISTGVALDRLVLPALSGEPQSNTVLAHPGSTGGTGPASDAPAGSTGAPGAGGSGPQDPGGSAQPSEEPTFPLKKLRMRDTDGSGSGDSAEKDGSDDGSSGGGGGSGGSGGSGGGSGDGGGGGGGGAQPPSGMSTLEAQVVELTNKERAKAGCPALRVDQRLVTAARGHSADMAAKGYFSHTSPNGDTFADRIKKAGYPSPGAENIAMGYPTAAAVMDGWMNSSGHRANILNCGLKAIGVGVQTGSGGPWWTQNFGWT